VKTRAADTGWQSLLRAQGYRLTAQRALVLEAVERLGHGTAEEIHSAVTERSADVNLSTVYRSLGLLDDLGLIRHVRLSNRTSVYHSRATPAHVHLACQGCGDVVDATPAEFTGVSRVLMRKYGFDVDLDRLVVTGTCATCARSQSVPGATD
jgi:Fur family ferric uptake transcriptional regulator